MSESGRRGDCFYLHAWDDYERFTVKVTASARPGIGRTYLRTASPAALDRRVAEIEAAGLGRGWTDEELGLGPVFLCADPDGHEFGLYWETERFQPTPELRPSLKNQASRFPGRGANVRRIDHVNYLAANVPACGTFLTEQTARAAHRADHARRRGRLRHLVHGQRQVVRPRLHQRLVRRVRAAAPRRLRHRHPEDILRAADVFLDNGIHIETGPHKHAIQQTFFLYVYEPGGNRIELANAGARLVLAPDWELVTWSQAERAKGQAWGLKTIDTFHSHGTPPVTAG
jgi:catechol 2,3-dioxygenase